MGSQGKGSTREMWGLFSFLANGVDSSQLVKLVYGFCAVIR